MVYKFTSIFLFYLYNQLFKERSIVFQGKDIGIKRLKIHGTKVLLRYFPLGDFIFVEQNPFKRSKHARKARKGKKIAWLINRKKNQYVARVTKDKVFRKEKFG